MIKKIGFRFWNIFHILSLIDAFRNVASTNASPFLDYFLVDANLGIQQVDRSELGFLDEENVDEIANSELSLVITSVIADKALTWLLVDNWSSCNVPYEDILESLNLKQAYLDLFGRENLLAFNDSVTHPCGARSDVINWRRNASEKMTLMFMMIPCRSAFKEILRRFFLEN